jgi:adenosylmethionine-8-amino-7-oxononanoate aminotransferase
MKDYEDLPPIIIEKASGSMLYDINGKRYIDIVASWWCNLFGHCNSRINGAVKTQLDVLEHVIFANFSHKGAVDYAERLLPLLPKGLKKLHFSDNGSSVVECALKMSFQYQMQKGFINKKKFMCLSEGYHGETIGALSVGSMDVFTEIYKPLLVDAARIKAPDCYRCPYGQNRENCSCECAEDARKTFEACGAETCALILEPLLQGAAGMRMYPAGYLRILRGLCDSYGVLLIADEIATGFGRTGALFACSLAGVSPDLMCLSKSITGGYMPFSVLAVTQAVYDAFYADYSEGKAFMHSHTFAGNPLGCAAANAALDIFETENVLEKSAETALWLKTYLRSELGGHPNIGEIRQIGLINALELVADKQTKTAFPPKHRTGYRIYKKALDLGLLLRPLGDVLYFNPALNIEKETLKEAVYLCKKAIEQVLH